MGNRKGDDDEEAAAAAKADRKAKKRRSKVAEAEDEDAQSDSEEDLAAKKGRKVALKATRRIARALGVKLKDGSDDGGDDDDDEQTAPFDNFPSHKKAAKLSESQREALVRTQGGVRVDYGERGVAVGRVIEGYVHA
jgi:pyruvate/2-oxoglutarate dehydrogenase complex dihydrolipoamide acyltransferase (E2) component